MAEICCLTLAADSFSVYCAKARRPGLYQLGQYPHPHPHPHPVLTCCASPGLQKTPRVAALAWR